MALIALDKKLRACISCPELKSRSLNIAESKSSVVTRAASDSGVTSRGTFRSTTPDVLSDEPRASRVKSPSELPPWDWGLCIPDVP